MGIHQDYDLVADSMGDQTIRISELPEVPGLRVRALYRDGSDPPSRIFLETCHWRVDGKEVQLQESPGGVAIVEFESDEWGQGRFKRIDLTYRVTDDSYQTLLRLKLRAETPYFLYKSAFVYRDVNRLLTKLLGIGALVGLAGLISQGIRFARRGRNRPSEIRNRQSPPQSP